MRTSNRIASLLATLALGGVLSAQAQGRDTTRQQPGMHQMGGMRMGSSQEMGDMQGMCTLMSGMHEGPDAALTHAQRLNLTDAQRTRLEAARTLVQQAHTTAMEQSRVADREIGAAAGGERVDEPALRSAFRRMADAHAQAAAAMLRARAETRATLTEQQRTQLAQLTRRGGAGMMGMMGGRDSGMAHQMPMGRDSGMAGHMGMMGMMMSHCATMRTTDTSAAHRH